MILVHRIGAILLALIAIAVWFALTPASQQSSSAPFTKEITSALVSYEASNATTSSAPQQQVVNG